MTKLNDLNYILDFLERKNEEGLIATSKSKMNAVHDVVRSFFGGKQLMIAYTSSSMMGEPKDFMMKNFIKAI